MPGRSSYSEEQISGFRRAAQSLKLSRRAEIESTEAGRSPIEDLYVDPLQGNHVLETILQPSTTLIIGRRGTGKSTIFQRAQHELSKQKDKLSVYLDIKTIWESSQTDSHMDGIKSSSAISLAPQSVTKLLLFHFFIDAIIRQLKDDLYQRIQSTFKGRIADAIFRTSETLFRDLDDVLDQSSIERFYSITGVQLKDIQIGEQKSGEHKSGLVGELSSKDGFSASVKAETSEANTVTMKEEREFSQILVRVFDITRSLSIIQDILRSLNIRHLYVFVDDFSELPESSMRIVIDTLLAPLNNWSEEFLKFKIECYPGRYYLGAIDPTKVDFIHLDLYDLYGTHDINTMEERAIEFVKRLVEKRINYYCHLPASEFIRDSDQSWEYLYYASLANPRTIGNILHYLAESLAYGDNIGVSNVKKAAQRYYEDKIEPTFKQNLYQDHVAFNEKLSHFSLRDLLSMLVQRAKDNKRGQSKLRALISGEVPSSHFHVIPTYEEYLSTLELNFFISKYYSMTDRDGRKVSVYSLNFGLCQKYNIGFGRPRGEREFRLWFVEREFDCTHLITEYLKVSQEILCDNCGQKFPHEQLETLRTYGFDCPSCRNGKCSIVMISQKYSELINSLDKELLLPKTELGIVKSLLCESESMTASQIAEELDCSYQLVGKRARNLKSRELLTKAEDGGRTIYELTERAVSVYGDAFRTDEDIP